MSNFQRQYKDPTHFQFFKVPIEKVSEIAIKLQEAFKKPDEPANKATIDTHKVESPAEGKKQSTHTIDEYIVVKNYCGILFRQKMWMHLVLYRQMTL